MSNPDPELEALRQKRLENLAKQPEAVTEPVILTNDTFDKFIEETPMVVVDFWAEWCGPCKMVAPILESLAEEYTGKVWVGKVNVDENPQLAMKYGASSIPTFWAFKEGVPVGRFVGALPRQAFENLYKQLIDLDMDKVRAEQEKNQ